MGHLWMFTNVASIPPTLATLVQQQRFICIRFAIYVCLRLLYRGHLTNVTHAEKSTSISLAPVLL